MNANRVRIAAMLGLVVLASCQSAAPPSRETVTREFWALLKANGEMGSEFDTLTFAAFHSHAVSDTADWNDTWAAWKVMRTVYSSILGRLGYGTGPFTWQYGPRERTALERFQQDLGIPVTRQIDSSTVAHLLGAQKALSKCDITLPVLYVDRIGLWFVAKGTWKAITNTLAYPVNSVDIACDGLRRECSVVVVDFISDELDQIVMNRYDLSVTHVTNEMLIARHGTGDDAPTLTINVPAKEVLWTQVNPARPADGPLPAREAQQVTMRLVSGNELSPPFDGGALKEVHDAIFKDKDRYLALLKKNTHFEEVGR